MKKALLLFGVIATIGLTACNRDYECVCTDATGNNSVNGSITGVSKSDAEDFCEDLSGFGVTCKAEEK